MAFQVAGKLHKVFETEQKSEKFRAREFVIEIVDGNYPQMVKFQLTQDKCELIDEYNDGDEINVHFNLRGREWNDRFFTNLDAWRIETADASAGSSSSQSHNQSQRPPAAAAAQSPEKDYPELTATKDDFSDDIPF